ncbi:MAG TPA: prepilin peptidase [Candidatus Limnocylindrales bacterium]|nr:prepilin peptidase [Candidatus Limnocylindrales bacterium]
MLVVLFLITMYTDARWLRIPNALTYPTMLIGLVLGALEAFPGSLFGNGLIDHLAGLVLAFAFAYPFYAAGGLKAGDAKLLMAIGAVRGTGFLLVSTVYGALLGGVLAIGFIAVRRMRAAGGPDASMSKVMKSSMPYGIALALGGLVALALEAAGVIAVRGT